MNDLNVTSAWRVWIADMLQAVGICGMIFFLRIIWCARKKPTGRSALHCWNAGMAQPVGILRYEGVLFNDKLFAGRNRPGGRRS
jgi:hypothetical protein